MPHLTLNEKYIKPKKTTKPKKTSDYIDSPLYNTFKNTHTTQYCWLLPYM